MFQGTRPQRQRGHHASAESSPAFYHYPIAYNGRTSSIVVSGTPVTRPKGIFRVGDQVQYGTCGQLDYELEVACVIGKPSQLGEPVDINSADDHIFGLILVNDWSARDIQALEMPPLGPMNGKSFATSIGPWIVTLEALAPFKVAGPVREHHVSSFLADGDNKPTYDVQLRAELLTANDDKQYTTAMCSSNLKWMYWNFRHMVAQQTVNGCNLNTGDLLASGTISGSTEDSHGCLLEWTWGGEQPFALPKGDSRTYLRDGDIVRITALAGDGVGFGECVGQILPSRS